MPIGPQIGKGVASASKFGFAGIVKFAIKHWYLISIFLFLLPTIITSVQIGIEEKNPVYPIAELGLTLINADVQIDQDVKILRKDPTELVGVKPEMGIINKWKYSWQWVLVIWKLLGNIFIISIPFHLAYRYFKFRGQKGVQSSTGKNVTSAIIVGFSFMFIMNLIFTVVGLADGTLFMNFPEGVNIFKKVLIVIWNTIPFHGTLNLILYLTGINFNI
jgi:hypothetical protein